MSKPFNPRIPIVGQSQNSQETMTPDRERVLLALRVLSTVPEGMCIPSLKEAAGMVLRDFIRGGGETFDVEAAT